jgi:uncharacterized protein DUF3303
MKYIVAYSLLPGSVKETVQKFLAGEAAPQEGVKLLGRWHRIDCSGGFALYETDRPEQMFRGTAKWADLMETETFPVLEDSAVGPILADVFKD